LPNRRNGGTNTLLSGRSRAAFEPRPHGAALGQEPAEFLLLAGEAAAELAAQLLASALAAGVLLQIVQQVASARRQFGAAAEVDQSGSGHSSAADDAPPAALPATHAKIGAQAVPAIRPPRGLHAAVVDEECRMGEDCGADLLEPGLLSRD